jgi:hypothetical protein
MQDRKWLPNIGYPDAALHSGPFIVTKSYAPTCDISNMKCVACLFAKASTQSPPNMAPHPLPKPHMLKSNHLTPGDSVSADHYFLPVPGRLLHTFGKEGVGYTFGSLFVDHANGKIFNFPQYSNNASKTIQCAQHLKSMARDEGFRIKAYHLDNRTFAAAGFQEHCKQQQQWFSFSGVGAKHQNGIAEWKKTCSIWQLIGLQKLIRDIGLRQLTTLFGLLIVCLTQPLASRLTNFGHGCNMLTTNFVAPIIFGCPVYVLDASLQDGKKIPKWNPWACLGLFLAFSDLHSSLVPLVLNIDMGHISPQFHVVFDDKFETVTSLAIREPLDKQWADIFWLGHECFLDVDYDVIDQPILPSLSDIIKLYSKAKEDQPNFEPGHSIDFDGIMVNNALVPPPNHEVLQDSQAVTPLQSQATSQAAAPPTLPVPRGVFDVPSVPVMPV